jgi:hypothetical protein
MNEKQRTERGELIDGSRKITHSARIATSAMIKTAVFLRDAGQSAARLLRSVAVVSTMAFATHCSPATNDAIGVVSQGIGDDDDDDDCRDSGRRLDASRQDAPTDGGENSPVTCRTVVDDDAVLAWEQSLREGRARLSWRRSGQPGGPKRMLFQSGTGVEIDTRLNPSERTQFALSLRVDQHSLTVIVARDGTAVVSVDQQPLVTPNGELTADWVQQFLQGPLRLQRAQRPLLQSMRSIAAELAIHRRLLDRLSLNYDSQCIGALGNAEARSAYAPGSPLTRTFGPLTTSQAFRDCDDAAFRTLLGCLVSAFAPVVGAAAAGPVALGVLLGAFLGAAICSGNFIRAQFACYRIPAVCPVVCSTNTLPVFDIPTGCCAAGQSCENAQQGICRRPAGPSCGSGVCNVGDVCFTPINAGIASARRCCDVGNQTTQLCRNDQDHVTNVTCCDNAAESCNRATGQCCRPGTFPRRDLCCRTNQIAALTPNNRYICCEPNGEVNPTPGVPGEFSCCTGATGQPGGYCPGAANTSDAPNRGGCCAPGTVCTAPPNGDQVGLTACCPANIPNAEVCLDGRTCCPPRQGEPPCIDVLIFEHPVTGVRTYQSSCPQ